MKLCCGLLIWISLWPLVACAEEGPPRTTAFVHVNVVPMDRERVLADQTVLVEGDKIVALGSRLSVPKHAQVIDGHKTAYLSPGLADMHTHSESRNDLAIYLANGVTTVLHTGGAHTDFVDSVVPAVNRGAIPGPHVYTSFKVDGSTDYNAFGIKTPESAYLSPNDRLAWQTSGYLNKTAKLEPKLAFLRMLVKAMADANVELVAGTDAPTVPGIPPGFSLHDSLSELEASGLTRYQSLSTATRAPGSFIRRTKGGDLFGMVAPGYRADLILSERNPLSTLATLRAPLGVMVKGQWRDAAALRALSDKVRQSYRDACEMR